MPQVSSRLRGSPAHHRARPHHLDRCGGPIHRLLSPAPFILKGGGWYVTDYPSEARKQATKSESSSSDSSASTSSDTPTAEKSSTSTAATSEKAAPAKTEKSSKTEKPSKTEKSSTKPKDS